jgi:protease-4
MKRWGELLVVLLAVTLVIPQRIRAEETPDPTAPIDQEQSLQADLVDSAPLGDDADAADSEPVVAWLEIGGALRESPPPFAWSQPQDIGPALRDVVAELRRIAEDDGYIGLVIFLDEPDLSLSQIQEISDAVRLVRSSEKKVFIFAEVYDLPTYLLACSADKVLLQRKGLVELAGLSVEEFYLAGLLEKIGAKADFLQVGAFKGASEPMTQTGPSKEWNQNMDSLLDGLYEQVLGEIADARHVSRETVERWLTECWSMNDEQYVKSGMIDVLTNHDMTDVTEAEFGDDFVWEDVLAGSDTENQIDNPFALFRKLFQKEDLSIRTPSIALIYASGPITMGDSQPEGPFGGSSTGSRTIANTLTDATDNDMIKGVVLRIDSPGGSAIASELIWQSVYEFSKEKPIYVSVNSMAARGGYYIACAGTRVYVSPSSIIGSIGVVGGKIVFGDLYQKIGVGVYRRNRGPLGDIFNSAEPFTPAQRLALQASFDRTYDLFTNRVMTGRGQRVTNIEVVAQGRLFTGEQAVQNGLADEIGGIETAIMSLAEEAGLQAGQYDVIDLPYPRSLSEVLQDFFQTSAAHSSINFHQAMIASARAILGERNWRSAQSVLNGLTLMQRESVLTLLPVAIMIH